ncbi:MAG: DNA starvation/stationary phase protection protein Dps [Synechococcales bacterium]|nr:DNA starvation/stationary phase protection protein Dps [Synechococcales bacterium]
MKWRSLDRHFHTGSDFDPYQEEFMVATPSRNMETTHRFYPTRIDLPADVRSQVTELLNQTLAATIDLKSQTKQAHWNVKGMDFYQLHELFDEMATELEEYVDMVAERVTALGGTAMGTLRIAAADSILPEYDLDAVEGAEHVTALAERFGAYAKHVRDGIDKTDELGDADTADLYTEISRTVDKRLWFLEAHLVKKSDLK